MKYIIIIGGILIAFFGMMLLISPEFLLRTVEDNLKETFFYITAILFRLILGVVLIMTAIESRYPTFMKVLGYVSVIAAIVFIIMGHGNFQEFISEFLPTFKPAVRYIGIVAMALGGFLIYAYTGKK